MMKAFDKNAKSFVVLLSDPDMRIRYPKLPSSENMVMSADFERIDS